MMLRLRLNLGVLPHIRKDPAIIIVISEKSPSEDHRCCTLRCIVNQQNGHQPIPFL
jgi:hypothetical protein